MVPEIDADVGMSIYSTAFRGTGGSIRERMEDFEVSEVLAGGILEGLDQNGGYPVYVLKKRGIDTNHALGRIHKISGLRLKALGLKDARAITEQYVCATCRTKQDGITAEKFSTRLVGYAARPLSKKDMAANRFRIRISGAKHDASDFAEFDHTLNYFGYQRFGSRRPVSHLIGRAMVRGDFDNAASLLLSFTSKYDRPENTRLRGMMQDPSSYEKMLGELSPGMDLERTVLSGMILHGDPKKAIRSIPVSMRRFFVQAYQSFLFNLTLSAAWGAGEDLFHPREGDVCFDDKGALGKYSGAAGQRLAVPLAGYTYYKKTRFDAQISRILESECIRPRDFFIKEMQEASSEGGFRNASIACSDAAIRDDTAEFTLGRGSFATIILREIMKPEAPLECGF